MANVLFININESLPAFSSSYVGWFVVDSNNKLYLGTSSGWEELTNKSLAESISNKEDVDNKVTSLSSSSTDDEYPSAKCVYDLIGDINSVLDNINGEVI